MFLTEKIKISHISNIFIIIKFIYHIIKIDKNIYNKYNRLIEIKKRLNYGEKLLKL